MFILSFLALSASIISVLSAPPQQVALGEQGVGPLETYLIETNPGETQWVTEDQKWALRRVRQLCIELPEQSKADLTHCRMA